jgi:hypothetical protein
LLVVLRTAAERARLAAGQAGIRRLMATGAPELDRLREAYLEPWTAEHPLAELREEARLALRLGPISQALTGQRVFPGYAQRPEHGHGLARWLAYMLEP